MALSSSTSGSCEDVFFEADGFDGLIGLWDGFAACLFAVDAGFWPDLIFSRLTGFAGAILVTVTDFAAAA
jgi:hypothetical protein